MSRVLGSELDPAVRATGVCGAHALGPVGAEVMHAALHMYVTCYNRIYVAGFRRIDEDINVRGRGWEKAEAADMT